MTYDEAIKYIHSTSNFFCKPGLDRIKELCSGLGNPQDKLKFIHVGGTNGKGSFCSMMSSVLVENGYKVGLYTSPYVKEFNERMRINGINIPNDILASITEEVKLVADKMTDSPTEFELITALAFKYFLEEKCDVVVLEVGMGGRFDATNLIKEPLLSVITGISIDHTAFLGDTVEKIALEKSGIIKQKSPTLYGGEDKIAEAIITSEATKMQSELYKTDYSALKINRIDLDGSIFSYKEKEDVKISLLGSYQAKNACIVLDAIDILNKRGLQISDEAARRGLAMAKWPARFEILGKDPLFIFDGAHNPQGISAAVHSIKSYFGDKKIVIISGVLADKDYNAIADSLAPVALSAYTITPENPRALSAEKYASVLKERYVRAIPCQNIDSALESAIADAIENNTAICCLGSLYTYEKVTEYLENYRTK